MNGFSLAQWRKAAKVKMVSFAFFAASREIPKVKYWIGHVTDRNQGIL